MCSLYSWSDLRPNPPPLWVKLGSQNRRFGSFALYLIIIAFTALECLERE